MFKRVLIAAAVAAAVSAPAFADVSITGSAEMDLFYRTNNTADGDGKLLEEIAIVVNINGSDKLDNGDTLKWKLAQKVATDWKFDPFGKREAWIGYQGGWGELRFGNQFTNTWAQMDWPYGVKGTGNLWADTGAFADTWGDAVSYFSPNFGGFSFAAQYKLGSQFDGVGSGDGFDLTASYGNDMFNLDAGYQVNNDQLVGSYAVGSSAVEGAATGPIDGAETSVFHFGARARFADFSVRAAYKLNQWDTGAGQAAKAATLTDKEVKAIAANKDIEFSQYLIGAGYSFGKNALTLSYQTTSDVKVGGSDVADSGVDQVAFQWDYQLGKNTWGGLQVRHQMYDTNGGGVFGQDGMADKSASSNTRALVYTWTAF